MGLSSSVGLLVLPVERQLTTQKNVADFSSAVRVTPDDRMRSDNVGVIYWQAPEVRKGEYDVMLVDIWSLGATVWELIEGTTPFEGQAEVGDRLPELSGSVSVLDFLEMCSSPPHYRPPAQNLLEVCRLSN
jgi:serine/threonine protein kinase